MDFLVLNIAEDELPAGDIVFIRQVLQHLDNAQITRVVPKLTAYRWAIVTEHLPVDDDFIPNRDKPTGPGIRTDLASGVVLDAPPFELMALETRELCKVRHVTEPSPRPPTALPDALRCVWTFTVWHRTLAVRHCVNVVR